MLNVGLIGCGFIAQKHVRALLLEPDVHLVAVTDTVPESMQSVVSQCEQSGRRAPKAFASHHELLACSTVDTVVVAVPSGLHAKMAKQALMQGKHVVVEKPMALSTADAEELCTLADAVGRRLVVCHQKRFYPHLQRVHDIVAQGKLGDIVFAEVSLMYNRNDAYYQSANWRGTKAMDGGLLLNQGIHNLDLLLWFTGVPSAVLGDVSRQLRAIETEDTAAAILRYANGRLATVSATVCAHPRVSGERIALFGTRGGIEMTGKQLEHMERWEVEGVERPEFVEVNPYRCLYRDLQRAIERGTRPSVDGWEGWKALRTILAIYEAEAARTVVHLPDHPAFPSEKSREMSGDGDV
ncbi:oxidoreductase [Alicyclobacillus contaminans]|uniref:Gfo/Idh/MocA family protein n=1 Tax=Alicyclobacillus contaminans TaxID=392016 RepID=UPI0004025BC3|nr:Gfo/Idh/MocA family oxidoreductase [Alicyclobacillus contaminans]GMA49518.1 oxidoreductase [Alicyclobacillus contaminans]